MTEATRFSCDIFCRVVDNYGDVGVTWRLARQLQREWNVVTRLFVDDLDSFAHIAGEGGAALAWPTGSIAPADLAIEAFACELPDFYIDAMAARVVKPVWINLEYLSAEQWVGECHLLPSPHPRLPLAKHFFFPGFDAATGGLLREADLVSQRDAFVPERAHLRVFLFAYANTATAALVAAIHATGATVTAPNGTAGAGLEGISVLPFVPQPQFDQLLWAHDILFVRGEDSFVRAQWAAKPFVWHIYPQADHAHWIKLNAFLDRYCVGVEAPVAAALRELWRAWNANDGAAIAAAWGEFLHHRDALTVHAKRWADQLAQTPDLATQLVTFFEKTYKI